MERRRPFWRRADKGSPEVVTVPSHEVQAAEVANGTVLLHLPRAGKARIPVVVHERRKRNRNRRRRNVGLGPRARAVLLEARDARDPAAQRGHKDRMSAGRHVGAVLAPVGNGQRLRPSPKPLRLRQATFIIVMQTCRAVARMKSGVECHVRRRM